MLPESKVYSPTLNGLFRGGSESRVDEPTHFSRSHHNPNGNRDRGHREKERPRHAFRGVLEVTVSMKSHIQTNWTMATICSAVPHEQTFGRLKRVRRQRE